MSYFQAEKYDVTGQEVEPIYLELAEKILMADRVYTPLLLKRMYSLEEAKIVRELPAPAEEIAKKLNLKTEDVEKTLQKLIRRGFLLRTNKGVIKLFHSVGGFGDISLVNPEVDKECSADFLKLVVEMLRAAATAVSKETLEQMTSTFGTGTKFRVIPRWKAIKDIPGAMPCEDMREIFKAYEGKLCNSRCFCRSLSSVTHMAEKHFKKCGLHEGTLPAEGHCNHLGYVAEYYVETMGITNYLTSDEMLASIEPLEKSRSYHMGPNRRDTSFVCNCCECCGEAGRVRDAFPGQTEALDKVVAPSRFLAVVDTKKCIGCGACATKCAFDAIELEGGKARINAKRCFGCGTCVLNCPAEALKMKLIRPADHIPVVEGPSIVEQAIFEVAPDSVK